MKKEDVFEKYKRMSEKELELHRLSYRYVAGIDEAGRGPLAGPVFVGVCILDPELPLLYLDDSKKLSEKKREQLYIQIIDTAVAAASGSAAPQEIDSLGINAAIRLATKRAFQKLSIKPDYCLFDYVSWDLERPGEKIVKGDSKIACIAAASIVAKVERDRFMRDASLSFPAYDFAKNKGYGTASHINALKAFGSCPLHRKSYIKNILKSS